MGKLCVSLYAARCSSTKLRIKDKRSCECCVFVFYDTNISTNDLNKKTHRRSRTIRARLTQRNAVIPIILHFQPREFMFTIPSRNKILAMHATTVWEAPRRQCQITIKGYVSHQTPFVDFSLVLCIRSSIFFFFDNDSVFIKS